MKEATIPMNYGNLINKSLVSVIIPTYKRATTLLDTVRSVLNQTYKNIEIIIVDDNGKGTHNQLETEELLKQYIENKQIVYVVHEYNKNGAAARNTGLNVSRGEYINFLDDDDKIFPQKIEEQVQRLLKTDKSIGATYCNSEIIHFQNITHKTIKNKSNVTTEGNLCREYILGLARFNTSMIMFKREAITNIGGFDESFARHQDYELMIRFFRNYDIVCTSIEPLAIYDQTSIRINSPDCKKDFLMKQKLVLNFTEDFEKLGAKNEICHYLWMRCAINSALRKNNVFLYKSLTLCREYGDITLKEYLKLAKAICIGLLKNT